MRLRNPSGSDIDKIIRIAMNAGDLVLDMQRQGLHQIRDKSSSIDLVTEADVACERLLRQELGELEPGIGFWGEESNTPPVEDLFWVVDPIDGTTNFANGLAYFAINIALHVFGETILGITLELPVRKIYWAIQGKGAYLREADGAQRKLQVNDRSELGHSLLTTGFPYHRGEHADNNSAEYVYFVARAQGVRCLGASALDLANVARGALAGYWEAWLQPWDTAAGVLLVREAGGRVTNYAGEQWQLLDSTLIASNGDPSLHAALVDGIAEARGRLDEHQIGSVEGK